MSEEACPELVKGCRELRERPGKNPSADNNAKKLEYI